MALYHHDDRPYAEATEAAAKRATARFEKIIEEGKKQGMTVLEKIIEEHPRDTIVPMKDVTFRGDTDLWAVIGETEKTLHDNVVYQFCAKTGLPAAYVAKLREKGAWGMDLLLRNMNDLASHVADRVLLRAVNGQYRGLLSDRYRCLDSRPLVESFAAACRLIGAVPSGGLHTDLRNTMRAVFPEIFWLTSDEPLLFGLEWHNSDFGKGAHEVRKTVDRLWCTNTAIRQDVLRQVHIGSRISDDVVFSQKTRELDTQTQASALADAVKGWLSRDTCLASLDDMKEASEAKVTGKQATEILKPKLAKAEVEKVVDIFVNETDTDKVPQGASAYRLSNCVSWLANETVNNERKLELQEVAGWLLGGK